MNATVLQILASGARQAGLSLRRPEDRLTLELAVRILQLAGELAN
jgi:hypothetical protein